MPQGSRTIQLPDSLSSFVPRSQRKLCFLLHFYKMAPLCCGLKYTMCGMNCEVSALGMQGTKLSLGQAEGIGGLMRS